MTGHHPFSALRAGMSTERRARNAEATRSMLRDIERQELALHELRQARRQSQEDLARTLNVGQPAIAKMERRADMYVGNLRRYIEALGGTLEIIALFPDGAVTITNFRDVDPRPEGQSAPTK